MAKSNEKTNEKKKPEVEVDYEKLCQPHYQPMNNVDDSFVDPFDLNNNEAPKKEKNSKKYDLERLSANYDGEIGDSCQYPGGHI